jgi:hypothetical protein
MEKTWEWKRRGIGTGGIHPFDTRAGSERSRLSGVVKYLARIASYFTPREIPRPAEEDAGFRNHAFPLITEFNLENNRQPQPAALRR